MRLVRHGTPGNERPGIVDAAGHVRDVSSRVTDFDTDFLSSGGLDRLSEILASGEFPVVPPGTRLGLPIVGSSKIVGVGMNFRSSLARLGMALPQEPMLFLKSTTSLAGPNDPIRLPPGSTKTDWEVELAIVIGAEAKRVPPDQAEAAIAGYAVFNDLSERVWQNERGGEWTKGKSFDGFGPLGPWLVTRDQVDPGNLDLWLKVNGKTVQSSNTADMVFSAAALVSYISDAMRLLPGDIIAAGTPWGTGQRLDPQRFLRRGDVVELGISGLGVQRAEVVEDQG